MRHLLITSLIFVGLACNKPNPTPELADTIYLDLRSQAEAAKKNLESEKKALEGFKKDLDTATPQTGAIKFAQKRYFESEFKVQKLEQLLKYYELRSISRKVQARVSYSAAFAEKRAWPDQEELSIYQNRRSPASESTTWNTKARLQEYERGKNKPVIEKKE